MATTDRRGATVSAADPPIGTNPNPDLAIKAPVRVATTGGNIVLSGLQTIDGVALAAGDRVLVKDQTDATTNGLYNAATGPWTRTIDANNNSQWARGTQVAVTDGTANGSSNWRCTATSPVTLGTTLLRWAQSTNPVGALVMPANTVLGNPTGVSATAQNANWPLLAGGARGQVPIKNSAAAGDASWYNAPWLNIEAFGGKGDNTTDNVAALNAALAALSGTGGAILFPAGKYRFNSAVSYNIPGGIFSVALVGAGQDATILTWPNVSGGLTITYAGAGSSVHVRDMSFTTGQNGGSTALLLTMGAASGQSASDLYRVTFRGDDGYNVANFWNIGLSVANVSNVAVDQATFFGAGNSGIGIKLLGLPGSSLYATQLNFAKSDFQSLATGIQYGSFVQGVTVDQCNFTGIGNGIISPAAQSGTLAQLAVTNSQFAPVASGSGIATLTAIVETQIANNLFIAQAANVSAINLSLNAHFTITGNEITGSGAGGTGGILVGTTSAGAFGAITGNDIFGYATGIALQAGSQNISVQGNTMLNATNITNAGTFNYIVNNPGYNPVGAAAIAVGASPFVYTAGSSPETIYIWAGTVSSVTFDKNGGALGVVASNQSPCAIELGPFEQLKVTYTVAPNMNKMVH